MNATNFKKLHGALLLGAAVGALWLPAQLRAVTVRMTYNAPATNTWICPPGVTNVQVECWGGGGAGGSARTTGNSATGIANGGGGGGGAYAEITNLLVTPGNSYTVVIPPVATAPTAGFFNGNFSPSGGNVTFTNEFGTGVTANGGGGGGDTAQSSTSTVTVNGGSGGAATSPASASFAGGNGAKSTSTAGGGSGSGASDTGAGNSSSASISTASATGAALKLGSDSAHNGGAGANGASDVSGAGVNGLPGNTPGGGGSGGGVKGVANASFTGLGGNGGAGQILLTYNYTPSTFVKTNNADNLNLDSSWLVGVAPASYQTVTFDSTVQNYNVFTLGAGVAWGGIIISNPAISPVTIVDDGNVLTNGNFGIDMSAATADLTLSNQLYLSSDQIWNVTNNRTLTIAGQVSGNCTITEANGGTVKLGAVNVLPSTISLALNAGTLDLNTFSQSIGNLTGSGVIDTVAGGAPSLTVNGGTFSGNIQNTAGSLSLVMAGSGTLILSGSNSFTGTTTISAGTLQLGGVNALQNSSGISMAAGTVLQSALNGVNVAGPITVDAAGTTVTINAPTNNPGNQAFDELILGGAIGGDGNVTFNSVLNVNTINTVMLNGQSTYGGKTLLTTSGGTASQAFILLGTNDALPTTTVLTLDGGTGAGTGRFVELNLNGFNQTLAGLTNITRVQRYQRVVNSDVSAFATLTISNNSDYAFGFGGAQTNGGFLGTSAANGSVNTTAMPGSTGGNNFGLVKSGSGTFTVVSANTYTGNTVINGGTLLVNNASGSATGAGAVSINNGGALGGTGIISGSVTNNYGGTLAPGVNGAGTLTVNGNLTLTPGSISTFAVNGTAGISSSVALGGNATYGGILNIVPSGNFTNGQSFNLFSGAGAASASGFSSISGDPGNGSSFIFTNGVLTVGTPSTNAYLSYLSLNPPSALSPQFAFNNFNYSTAQVTNNTPTVTVVDADKRSQNWLIYNGTTNPLASGVASAPLSLINGATNTVQILVLAPDGITMNTYTVNITTTTNNLYARPFIWVRGSDLRGIKEKIATNAWATSEYNQLVAREAADFASYMSNRVSYLYGLPVVWSSGLNARFKTQVNGTSGNNGVAETMFNNALDCAMLYYLTGNPNYAQCAADVLHNTVTTLLRDTPSALGVNDGGWIITGDLLYEARQLGEQLPLIYDLIYPYLQNNQVYDVPTASMVNFNFANAQTVFRTYYDLVRNNGGAEDNWSTLMSPCMLQNLLALDSASERAADLQVYLNTGGPGYGSLKANYNAAFTSPGNIWPESFQYSSSVSGWRTYTMVLLERYDPTLNLINLYSNLTTSLPRHSQFHYPDASQTIMFGDGHRNDASGQPYAYYMMVYQHALARGYTNLVSLYGGLLSAQVNSAGLLNTLSDYSKLGPHNEPVSLLWSAPKVTQSFTPLAMPQTDTLPWAGLSLQRNFVAANNSVYGLECFVEGAGHVHSAASGMNMEIYGMGQVVGQKSGVGSYTTAIHENYYRVFAGANTVIVNGVSQGSGGWAGISINTVQNVAMEPQPFATGVSQNFSFTCSSFADTMGSLSEATEQRTMAIIRTSPTNGFYVDFFRSRSPVTSQTATTLNGNVTDQFHDYIYRNIGAVMNVYTNNVLLPLLSQPNRFNTDIGDSYHQPGWKYFSNTVVSYPENQATRVHFAADQPGTIPNIDTEMWMPAITNREYAKVGSPPFTEYGDGVSLANTLVARQIGDAWNTPFAVVYEPYYATPGATINNVTALWSGKVVVGMQIQSVVSGKGMVHYVLSNTNATDTYQNPSLGLTFTGRFAVISDDSAGNVSLYIGQGKSLSYRGNSVTFNGGATSQAEVRFSAGQAPSITANALVTVTPAAAPNFASVSVQPNGTVSLTTTGAQAVPYTLWARTNLLQGSWTAVFSGTVTNSPFVIQDPGATGIGTRYYRLSSP
jgi:autotransporter-associated beta strand protein